MLMTYDDNNCYGIGSYCNHNRNPTLTLTWWSGIRITIC